MTSGYEIFSARPTVEALRNSYGNYVSSSYDYIYQETGRTENITANIVATYAKRWGDHDFKAMAGSNLEKVNINITGHNAKICLTQEKQS